MILLPPIQQKQIDYEKYGLKENPFTGTVPKDRVNFTIQRDREMQQAFWTLRSALSGVSTHAVIVGGYGNGKTHLVKYLEYLTNEQALDVDKGKALAIYAHSPGENFRQLYSTIILKLGKNFLQDVVWQYLCKICLRSPEAFGVSKDQEEALQLEPLNLKDMVKKGHVLLSDLMQRAKDDLTQRVQLIDFTTALLHLILNEYSFLAWKWLAAEDMPYEQRKDLGLSMAISNDDRALRAFLSLKNVLNEVGYHLIVLLIDEFELITALPERTRQRILNEVRHLIDLIPSGLCIFLACAPEAWRVILEHYHAFLERFTHTLFLRPLNSSQTLKLVTAYLKKGRLNSIEFDDKRFPFTSESVAFIHSLSFGNIRSTLKLCQIAIDFGLMNGLERLEGEPLNGFLASLFQPVEKSASRLGEQDE